MPCQATIIGALIETTKNQGQPLELKQTYKRQFWLACEETRVFKRLHQFNGKILTLVFGGLLNQAHDLAASFVDAFTSSLAHDGIVANLRQI